MVCLGTPPSAGQGGTWRGLLLSWSGGFELCMCITNIGYTLCIFGIGFWDLSLGLGISIIQPSNPHPCPTCSSLGRVGHNIGRCITCVHRKVVLDMEDCGMSSTGCVVHVVVHGQWVVLWVAATLLQLSVAGMVS